MAVLDSKDSYRDNPLLKKAGVITNWTKELIEEYKRCANDPVYFRSEEHTSELQSH